MWSARRCVTVRRVQAGPLSAWWSHESMRCADWPRARFWTARRSTATAQSPPESESQADDPAQRMPSTSLPHFAQQPDQQQQNAIWTNPVPHPVYDLDKIHTIDRTHVEPKALHDRVAWRAVTMLRAGFDVVSRYRGPGGQMTERAWLNRCLFLETIAGVPGMVGGMVRHLRSLRVMRRDYGWIHSLLEEAENERMHLLIFLHLKQPTRVMRLAVLGGQGVFFNLFFLAYLISPRTCHRFVGYLEEEAVKTYSSLLQDIRDGHLQDWTTRQAPLIAREYYQLPEHATCEHMIECIRADEANHRDVNHTFAALDPARDINPYIRAAQARRYMQTSKRTTNEATAAGQEGATA